ncbi:hypothetical protein, partial [Haladaptatus sp. R4]|uniref:hypothetical protein n=1 Tax=Haladaptatus sp. R4 TaxID=1679489 RepID=UPI000B00C386
AVAARRGAVHPRRYAGSLCRLRTRRVIPYVVVGLAPLVGIAFGTLLVWIALTPGLAGVVAGEDRRAAARATVGTAFADPRRTGTLVGIALVLNAVVADGGVAFLFYAARTASPVTFLVVVTLPVLTVVLVTPFCYAAVVDGATTEARGTDGGRSSSPRVPVRRAVVACLIVLALVASTSMVRVTETRPTPNAATPLPSDPTAAYATAVSNTFASNNRIEYLANDGDGSHAVYNGFVLDRTNRRFRTSYRSENENNTGYADAGVEYALRGGDRYLAVSTRRTDRGHVVWAYPGYWVFRQDYGPTGGYGVPRPDTGAWNVVAHSNDTETLELDGAAAFRAVGVDPPANADYHSAWVRMRVDTDRGVLLGGAPA